MGGADDFQPLRVFPVAGSIAAELDGGGLGVGGAAPHDPADQLGRAARLRDEEADGADLAASKALIWSGERLRVIRSVTSTGTGWFGSASRASLTLWPGWPHSTTAWASTPAVEAARLFSVVLESAEGERTDAAMSGTSSTSQRPNWRRRPVGARAGAVSAVGW